MADGELIDKGPFRRLMEARRKNDLATVAKSKAGDDKDEAELAIYELLVDSGVKGELKLDLGPPWGTQGFTADNTIFGRVIDKDSAIRSLEITGHDDILVRERSISGARLNEHVNDLLEQGSPLPEGIDINDKKRVKVASKKSKEETSA